MIGIGKRMPAPTAEDSERRCLGVVIGEGLQTRHVEIECEIPITNRHRAERIGLMNHDIVPADQRVTINQCSLRRNIGARLQGQRYAKHHYKQFELHSRIIAQTSH